ncbi:GNAT family N-acetyltransferase [Nocardia sp. NPDC055321]
MEIRRIHDGEGAAVCELWDRQGREAIDGGPLTGDGRANLSRMLDVSAWHRDAFCLVAVADGRIVGFVNGRTAIGDGLLPGILGEIESLYVVPEERGSGAGRALAEAAVLWLRAQGAGTIRRLACTDAHDDHRFWAELGFETDMVCMSLYSD